MDRLTVLRVTISSTVTDKVTVDKLLPGRALGASRAPGYESFLQPPVEAKPKGLLLQDLAAVDSMLGL